MTQRKSPTKIAKSLPAHDLEFVAADEAAEISAIHALVESQQQTLDEADIPIREFERKVAFNKFQLFRRIRLDEGGEQKLEAWLEKAGISVRTDSPLQLKVARLIRGSRDKRGRRASDDSKILQAAEAKWPIATDGSAPTIDEFLVWVEDAGGLDTIYRADFDTTASPDGTAKPLNGKQKPKKTQKKQTKSNLDLRLACCKDLQRRISVFEAEFVPSGAKSGDLVVAFGLVTSNGVTDFKKVCRPDSTDNSNPYSVSRQRS